MRWPKLWEILLETSRHLVHLIPQLYLLGTSKVRVDNILSGKFSTATGVRRVRILSLLLFNIYREHVMKEIENWDGGIAIGDTSNLRQHTDDS